MYYNIILMRHDILAKPIAPTPTLFGAETKEFLKEMKRPDTPNEKKLKKELKIVVMLTFSN